MGVYSKRLEDYCEMFGVHVRNIKRWVKIGREAEPADLPPLDDPSAMAAWWGRCMKHRVPSYILSLASADPAVERVSCIAAVSADVCTNAPAEPSAPPRPVGEVGMSAALGRLREAERAAHNSYLAALTADPLDPGRIENTQRSWERLAEALRKAEKDSVEILSASFIPRAELTVALQQIHSSISQGVRGLVRRVRPRLAGQSLIDQDAIWDAEVDRLFEAFRAHDFSGAN